MSGGMPLRLRIGSLLGGEFQVVLEGELELDIQIRIPDGGRDRMCDDGIVPVDQYECFLWQPSDL